MSDMPHDGAEIKDTDIVFDCPHCGKSLAIDYRGAGLMIPCTDCGKNVQVPIPDGMEITDVDISDEEKEARIVNLRRSLAASEMRIKQLEAEVEELTVRRDQLEKVRAENMFRFGTVLEKTGTIQRSLEEIAVALHRITESAR
jgi:transcription elongation factor Elf1